MSESTGRVIQSGDTFPYKQFVDDLPEDEDLLLDSDNSSGDASSYASMRSIVEQGGSFTHYTNQAGKDVFRWADKTGDEASTLSERTVCEDGDENLIESKTRSTSRRVVVVWEEAPVVQPREPVEDDSEDYARVVSRRIADPDLADEAEHEEETSWVFPARLDEGQM